MSKQDDMFIWQLKGFHKDGVPFVYLSAKMKTTLKNLKVEIDAGIRLYKFIFIFLTKACIQSIKISE